MNTLGTSYNNCVLYSAEERRKNIEELNDELRTMKRRHAASVKVSVYSVKVIL